MAHGNLVGLDLVSEQPADPPQDIVRDAVAEGSVDLLELVDVDDDQSEMGLPGSFVPDEALEDPAVSEPGQLVLVRPAPGFPGLGL